MPLVLYSSINAARQSPAASIPENLVPISRELLDGIAGKAPPSLGMLVFGFPLILRQMVRTFDADAPGPRGRQRVARRRQPRGGKPSIDRASKRRHSSRVLCARQRVASLLTLFPRGSRLRLTSASSSSLVSRAGGPFQCRMSVWRRWHSNSHLENPRYFVKKKNRARGARLVRSVMGLVQCITLMMNYLCRCRQPRSGVFNSHG
jgi:hypothetical protein